MENSIPEATHIGELQIGEATIKCAVLRDGTRILTRATFLKAIGRTGKAKGGREYDDEFRTPVFLTAKNLESYIPDTILGNSTPVIFKLKGRQVIGYKAELLPQVCGVFIDAERAGVLLPSQIPIAQKCDILLRGFATVGIVALVDEATGYQQDRARDALEEILRKFISDELLKWVKTFPDEFYRQMFRLRGWDYSEFSTKRPAIAGKITNDIVYRRLAPGVLEELKSLTPKDSKGRRRHKYFQRLTEDIGHPALREHLASVITLMKASSNWRNFYSMLNRALPQRDATLPMLIESDDGELHI